MTSNPLTRFLTQRSAVLGRRNRMRPMSAQEILGVSQQFYQLFGREILKSTAVAATLCTFAIAFVGNVLLPQLFLTNNSDRVSVQLAEAASTLGITLLVAIPLFLVGVSYTSAIVIQFVADYMNGNIAVPSLAKKQALKTWRSLIILNLRESVVCTAGLLISVGLLGVSALLSDGSQSSSFFTVVLGLLGIPLGFVVYIYLIGRHALAAPIVHLEGLKASDAAKRSRSLLKKDGRIPSGDDTIRSALSLLFLMTLIIPGGISASVEGFGVKNWVSDSLAGTILREPIVTALEYLPAFLLIWTTVPVWAATTTLLYYQRRIRKEGLDIETLGSEAFGGKHEARYRL